jgi:hypothetical protein
LNELSACCSAATLRMTFSCWYTLPTPFVEGACRVSKSAAAFLVDGNDDGSGSKPDHGIADGGGSLHPHRGLALVQLSHLVVEGCLLTCKLVVGLSYPSLSVDLLSVGSRLLFLLVRLLLIREELHSWLGCRCPHRDRRDGMGR